MVNNNTTAAFFLSPSSTTTSFIGSSQEVSQTGQNKREGIEHTYTIGEPLNSTTADILFVTRTTATSFMGLSPPSGGEPPSCTTADIFFVKMEGGDRLCATTTKHSLTPKQRAS